MKQSVQLTHALTIATQVWRSYTQRQLSKKRRWNKNGKCEKKEIFAATQTATFVAIHKVTIIPPKCVQQRTKQSIYYSTLTLDLTMRKTKTSFWRYYICCSCAIFILVSCSRSSLLFACFCSFFLFSFFVPFTDCAKKEGIFNVPVIAWNFDFFFLFFLSLSTLFLPQRKICAFFFYQEWMRERVKNKKI